MIIKQVYKRIQGLLRKKIKNTRAKAWIENELAQYCQKKQYILDAVGLGAKKAEAK